jgi:hypothetical protein
MGSAYVTVELRDICDHSHLHDDKECGKGVTAMILDSPILS